MKHALVALIMACLALPSTAQCREAPSLPPKPFVLAMIRPENDFLGKWWRLIYTEMFRRLGTPLEFRDYPSLRASAEIDAGRVDGEPGRIRDYRDSHPNLILIDEPLFALNFTAFAASPSIPRLASWEDLKGSPYRVAFNRGIKICELNLPRVVARERLTSVTDPIQGIKQLVAGHIDLYVDQESGILTLLRDPPFRGGPVRKVGVMAKDYVYPYVHRKHADLAPRMKSVLKALKKEGLIERYHRQVQKQFGIKDE
jgi:hypothetical protein